MKKLLFLVALILVTVSASGCMESLEALLEQPSPVYNEIKAELDSSTVHPLYASLSEQGKELYVRLCADIETFGGERIPVATCGSVEQCKQAEQEFSRMFRHMVYERPEYFWLNPFQYETVTVRVASRYRLYVKLGYMMDEEEAKTKSQAFDVAVGRIVDGANAQQTTFDKVRYVHDAILESTVYDYALAEDNAVIGTCRNAYGCLVEGKTVCSGYALGFNLILQRLGIPCGVEFDHNEEDLSTGHVWNYCTLDAENYYFDLTWNDTGFDSEEYKPYLDYSYTYFGITGQELARSHDTWDDPLTPACDGTAYNYYVYNGWSLKEYTQEAVAQILQAQADNGYYVLRFESPEELERAQTELIGNQKIFELLPELESITYLTMETNLHLYIFPE